MKYDSSRDLNLMPKDQKQALAAALASPNQKANKFAAAGAPRRPVDAQAAWEEQTRQLRIKQLQDEFTRMGAPADGLGTMAAQADQILNNPRKMRAGSAEHRLYQTAKSASDSMAKRGRNPSDQAGNAVRRLLPGSGDADYGGPPPFITQGATSVPNPAFGKYHGMEWNGESWVNLPPNADLEREAMEIQLEEMRRNARGNPDLRSWLQGRMERK